ncbi:hypothetical protein IWQ60_000723 [Tieghemiomyces parasiticus]|uniref:Uncharacterized protein n=1 Tax=Tieghemiomyces parasiticus TaxID=78921 RepID=A0A9W8AKP1_9FUNG|nr:hypothetical protein IWQ60_000723 [Tieghemiomyces parasiticus]
MTVEMPPPAGTLVAHPGPTTLRAKSLKPVLKSWPELKAIVESGRLELLRRTPANQAYYEKRRKEINQTYGNMTRYIVEKLLGWSIAEQEPSSLEDRLAEARSSTIRDMPDSPLPADSFDPSLARLLPNDFPYAIEPTVSHYVLWYKNPLQRSPEVDQYLERAFPDHDLLFFINPPHLQSVRTISHGHLFVRPRHADSPQVSRI